MTPTYSTVRYCDIEVCWTPELDGGGMTFGQDYLPIVSNLFGRVNRLCEVCAGPGFIGFSLLAHGMCESLVLVDVNPAAVAAAQETVRRNGLADRVSVYLSDGLKDLPAHERCDLFVANPPHFGSPVGATTNTLLTDDVGWRMHRAFFADVGRFLSPGGSVLWQKNSHGATPDEFLAMIDVGGLRHVSTVWFTGSGNATLFYLWAKSMSPDLVVDDGHSGVVTIDLVDAPSAMQELSCHETHVLKLRNLTGRAVSIRLVNDAGAEPLGAKARAVLPMNVAVNGELLLPRLALHRGNYLICDETDDAALAQFRTVDTPAAGTSREPSATAGAQEDRAHIGSSEVPITVDS